MEKTVERKQNIIGSFSMRSNVTVKLVEIIEQGDTLIASFKMSDSSKEFTLIPISLKKLRELRAILDNLSEEFKYYFMKSNKLQALLENSRNLDESKKLKKEIRANLKRLKEIEAKKRKANTVIYRMNDNYYINSEESAEFSKCVADTKSMCGNCSNCYPLKCDKVRLPKKVSENIPFDLQCFNNLNGDYLSVMECSNYKEPEENVKKTITLDDPKKISSYVYIIHAMYGTRVTETDLKKARELE